MKKYLIELGDYFDSNNLFRQANQVDYYLYKLGNDSFSEQESFTAENTNEKGEALQLTNSIVISTMHPLAQLAINFMRKVFKIAEYGSSKSTEISLKDIKELVAEASKYDANDFNRFKNINENPNMLYPAIFRNLLNQAYLYLERTNPTSLRLDLMTVADWVKTAVKVFEDLYLEEYMGMEPEEYGIQKEYNPRTSPTKVKDLELTPEEREKLWEQQKKYHQKPIEIWPSAEGERVEETSEKPKEELPDWFYSTKGF